MATNKPTIDLTQLPPQPAGLGSIFSNSAQALVSAAQFAQVGMAGLTNLAAAGEQLSLIALDKATNMRETVAIQDAMTLAVLRALQQQQLEQLQAKGLEIKSDLFAD